MPKDPQGRTGGRGSPRKGFNPRVGTPAAARDMTGLGIPQLYVGPHPGAEAKIGQMGLNTLDNLLFGFKGHEMMEGIDRLPGPVRAGIYGSPAEMLPKDTPVGQKMAFDPLLAVAAMSLLGGAGIGGMAMRSAKNKINQMTRRNLDEMAEAGLNPLERAYLHLEDAPRVMKQELSEPLGITGNRYNTVDHPVPVSKSTRQLEDALRDLQIQSGNTRRFLDQVDRDEWAEILPELALPEGGVGSKANWADLEEMAASNLGMQRAAREDPVNSFLGKLVKPKVPSRGGYLPVMDSAADDVLQDLLPVSTVLKRGGLEDPYVTDFVNLMGLPGEYGTDMMGSRLNMQNNLQRLGYLAGGEHTRFNVGGKMRTSWGTLGDIVGRVPSAVGGNMEAAREKELADIIRDFLKGLPETR